MVEDKPLIYRIVLTGEPGAGKSTTLAALNQVFTSLGYLVLIVPESATILKTGGVTLGSSLREQSRLLKLQTLQEEIFLQAAQDATERSSQPCLILYDRGMMDVSAYMEERAWKDWCIDHHTANLYERDQRYDAVLHLTTSPKHYSRDNNSARTEELSEAISLNHAIQRNWLGHPHLRIIGNYENFQDKIQAVIDAIKHIVGIPQPLEIEKKFLVKGFDLSNFPVSYEMIRIKQTYLKTQTGQARVRSRSDDADNKLYYYCWKYTIQPGQNIEIEHQISLSEYLELLKTADTGKHIIEKERVYFVWRDQYLELDHFLSPVKDLWLLEIEHEDKPIELPSWLKLEEVTSNLDYSNNGIACTEWGESYNPPSD